VLKDTAQSSKEFQRDNLALVHHLRFLKMIVFRLIQSPGLWNELSVQLKKSADLEEDILRESNLDDADRITVAYSLASLVHHESTRQNRLSYQSRIRRELDSAVAPSRWAV
jgi:hypothetical protein